MYFGPFGGCAAPLSLGQGDLADSPGPRPWQSEILGNAGLFQWYEQELKAMGIDPKIAAA